MSIRMDFCANVIQTLVTIKEQTIILQFHTNPILLEKFSQTTTMYHGSGNHTIESTQS